MSLFWETAAGIAAGELIQHAKQQGWLTRFVNLFRKKHNVLVLGATGVGKSNMLTSFVDAIPSVIHYMNRTEVMKENRVQIGDSPFIFIDTPGQIAHKAKRLQAIRKSLAKGISIIINVTAYGYHENRIGLNDALTKQQLPRANYLRKHRAIEIQSLSEWTPILGDNNIADGLITCVTKADLWWQEDSYMDVINHYEKGPYYNGLGPAQTLDHTVAPYSAVFHKFYGKSPLTGEFDDEDRVLSKTNLLGTMLALVGRANLE